MLELLREHGARRRSSSSAARPRTAGDGERGSPPTGHELGSHALTHPRLTGARPTTTVRGGDRRRSRTRSTGRCSAAARRSSARRRSRATSACSRSSVASSSSRRSSRTSTREDWRPGVDSHTIFRHRARRTPRHARRSSTSHDGIPPPPTSATDDCTPDASRRSEHAAAVPPRGGLRAASRLRAARPTARRAARGRGRRPRGARRPCRCAPT